MRGDIFRKFPGFIIPRERRHRSTRRGRVDPGDRPSARFIADGMTGYARAQMRANPTGPIPETCRDNVSGPRGARCRGSLVTRVGALDGVACSVGPIESTLERGAAGDMQQASRCASSAACYPRARPEKAPPLPLPRGLANRTDSGRG